MSKKIIIIIVIIAAAVAAACIGTYFWLNFKKAGGMFETTSDAAQKIINDATKGVLPSLRTNPLENKPDINPAANANPIKNIKINPFE